MSCGTVARPRGAVSSSWPPASGSGLKIGVEGGGEEEGAAAGTHASPQGEISPDAHLRGPMSTSAKGRDESAAQVGAVTSVPRALRLEEEARGAQPSLPRAPRRQSAVHRAPTPSVTPPRGQLPPHEALKAVFQNHRRFLRSFLSLRARGRAASPPPRHPDRDPRESRSAPGPCRRRPRAAPRRTRWRSWSTTSTRSTSTRTPPRCCSSRPRPAFPRRRRRNGLSSAWPSGGSRKASPQKADPLRTKEMVGIGSFPP